MILEFSIKNYRSIKDKITFSLVAESSKSKSFNIFNQILSKDDEVRLLKVAAIYGANASGKTNIARALHTLLNLLGQNGVSAGDKIRFYDPFKFAVETQNQPCEFQLTFVGSSNFKYIYDVAFTAQKIVREKLVYFPKGQTTVLFERIIDDFNADIDKIKLGNSLGRKEFDVFANKLGLGIFGNTIPHALLTPVFTYFKKISVINFASSFKRLSKNAISKMLNEDSVLLQKVNELLKLSDTKIEEIAITKPKNKLGDYKIASWHSLYENGKIIDNQSLPLEEESEGTKSLYILGGAIFDTLKNHRVLFIDELDSSLHPHLSRMLLKIFQSPVLNPSNAQLIFTSHDTHLLDKTLLRKDQIWFTEKNDRSETQLFSLQDFDGVREDTAFEKWYMAGKFGAIPDIGELEKLVSNG